MEEQVVQKAASIQSEDAGRIPFAKIRQCIQHHNH